MTPQGVTRSQLLEENISILEARIQELEHPDAPSTSVKLSAPPIGGSANIGPTMPSGHNVPASATDSRVNLTPDEIYSLWVLFKVT